MAVDAQSINMDDIFSGITLDPIGTQPVSAHSIPPEPRSRVSSGQSTLKDLPIAASRFHAESQASAMAPSAQGSRRPSKVSLLPDDIFQSVFSGVASEPVQSPTEEHHYALDDLDLALAGEETDHHEADSVVSSHHSHQSHGQSHYSHAPSEHFSHAPSVHTGVSTHPHSQVSNGPDSIVDGAAQHVANSVVNGAFSDLHSNGYHSEVGLPAPDYNAYGEPAHLPFDHQRDHNDLRHRTMTTDSTVSYGESRFGEFDVHDDNGPTATEINLNHNEVAYVRPKHKMAKSIAVSQNSMKTGGTLKLQEINREVIQARQKQAELTAEVERTRSEVERLRQQSLASEAVIKKIGGGVRPPVSRTSSVHSVKSYSDNYIRAASVASRNTESGDSIYDEGNATVSEIAEYQKENGRVVAVHGKTTVIVPQLDIVQGFSKNSKIHKVIIGGHANPTEDDKTVLLFGPVGSGKTSTINSMLNYLYDVKRENDFRFVLDEEIHKTNSLTAYVINNSILPYSVTIVDTPGIVDEKNNRTVSSLIKAWFEEELVDAGAFRLDAISIVLRHDENSLGWPFIYELAAVKKMFGDDLKTNVLPIITHSEVLPQPIAIRSLAQANIAFVEYYKVNNIGFAAEAPEVTKLNHNLFFHNGVARLETFFRDLQELIHPLLAILRNPAASRRGNSTHQYDHSALY